MGQRILGQVTNLGKVESLSELLAAAILTAAKLCLYKNEFSPAADSLEADFEAVEADFNGYAEATLTWSPVAITGDGPAYAISSRAFFQATDGLVANSIGGAWLKSRVSAGPPTVDVPPVYYPFPVPVPISVALAAISAEVVATSPDLSGYLDLDT